MSRGILESVRRSVVRMEQVLTEKVAVRDMGPEWIAEKETDLKTHILPHASRLSTHMETLGQCTARLKPEVTGVSLLIGNGVASTSARYFFYEHFCSLRFNNPKLKYDVKLECEKSQVRIHLDPVHSPSRDFVDLPTNGRMPHQIMDELCSVFAESGDPGTCTSSFEWKTDPESFQSPTEATEQRLHKAKMQLEELEMQTTKVDATAPIEISDLPLEAGEELNLDLIFKPIDLLDTENRPPPTNPREELRERRRVLKLELKNKAILMKLRSKAEDAQRLTADE